MSYQDYAQLRSGGRREGRMSVAAPSDASWQQKRAQRMTAPATGSSSSDERPYVGSHASFSAPRPAYVAVATQRPASHYHHTPDPSLYGTATRPSTSASQTSLYNSKRRTAAAAAAQEPLPSDTARDAVFGTMPEKSKADLVKAPLPWRPAYLQRRVLSAFIALFVALGIALEAVLGLSNRTPGLGPADRPTSLRYAFQMVPVAIMLLVTAAWQHVEYQARSSAPWLRLASGAADAGRTLLLDYVSMVRPAAVVKAVRNGDLIVACAVMISLLLRGGVVVSTALVVPTLLTVTDRAAQLVVTSQFSSDAGVPLQDTALSLAYVAGLQNGNVSYPDGFTNRFAYQRFMSDSLQHVGAQIGTTVDSFIPDLPCESATLSVTSVRASQQAQQIDATFSTPGCSIPITISGNGLVSAANETVHFLNLGRGGCGGSTELEDQRLVAVFGIINIDAGSVGQGNNSVTVGGSVRRSTQIICEPGYTIQQMDVVMSDIDLVAAQLTESPPRMLDGIHPWDVATGIFDSYAQADRLFARELSTNNALPDFLPARVVVDPLGHFAFGLRLQEQGMLGRPADYLRATVLAGLVADYFRHHAAILAFTSLSRKTSVPAQGRSAIREDRLAAKPVAVHFVAAVLGLCMVLTIPMILLVPIRGFLPRNPGTLMDTAALLGHSRSLLQALKGAGAADTATLWERLGGARFYTGVEPYEQDYASGYGYFKIVGGPLRPDAVSAEYAESGSAGADAWPQQLWMHWPARLASLAAIAALIAALEATLRVSMANDGIVTVDDGVLAHFAWTAIPAFVLVLLVIYVGLVDFTIRALAPFSQLAREGSFRTMTTNLVDRTAPWAMYEAIATRNWAVVLSTSSVFAASLLPVLVASAFWSSAIPAAKSVQVQTQEFFNTGTQIVPPSNSSLDPEVMASLVLSGNASYPVFTYKDLVFPNFTLQAGAAGDSLPDNALLAAVIPAVRVTLGCKLFTQPELGINLTRASRSLRIDAPNTSSSESRSIIIDLAQTLEATIPDTDGNSFIGAARFIPIGNAGKGTWLYGWGRLSNANTDRATVSPVYALSCDEKMQRLSVAANFRTPSMDVEDITRPAPASLENSLSDSSVFLPGSESSYANLVKAPVPGRHNFDGFFSQLVTSRYAIPLDTLGGGQKVAESVGAAIVAQHSIVRAQTLSAMSRRPVSTTATPVSADSPGAITEADSATGLAPGPVVARARLELPAGQPPLRRLRQDPIPTRVLEALLGATLAATAAAWLLTADAALPRLRGPSALSIAGVGALLADGNLFGILGRGAEWKPVGDLAALFRDGLHVTMRFRLGWEETRESRRDRRATALRGTMTSTARGTGSLGGGARGGRQVLAISAVRTGGWGGGENVGLGLQARVGFRQRKFVRDWGWKT